MRETPGPAVSSFTARRSSWRSAEVGMSSKLHWSMATICIRPAGGHFGSIKNYSFAGPIGQLRWRSRPQGLRAESACQAARLRHNQACRVSPFCFADAVMVAHVARRSRPLKSPVDTRGMYGAISVPSLAFGLYAHGPSQGRCCRIATHWISVRCLTAAPAGPSPTSCAIIASLTVREPDGREGPSAGADVRHDIGCDACM